MTRDTDRAVPLVDRARLASATGADVFVSIHLNPLEVRGTRGVETYYLGLTDDPPAMRLANRENRASAYSLADLREVVAGAYRHVKHSESRLLAGMVHHRLVSFRQALDPRLRDRGVKTAPFHALVATAIPAILVEIAFLSNTEDARRLADLDYRQALAAALYQGIRDYADSRNRASRELAGS